MKLIIYAIAALQIALFIFLGFNPDVSSVLQGQGRATLVGLVLAVCLVPALVLTIAGRAPFLSLVLALAPAALLAIAISTGMVPGLN